MLVLIDESGCSGFKLSKGSSPYFAIAMVIFDNFIEAERASKLISSLQTELRVKPEFKFSKAHPEVKDKFFKLVNTLNFKVRALYINKSLLYSPKLRQDTGCFYNYFVQMLMKHDGGCLNNAVVKIDGSGDKEFKKALSNYLRRELGAKKLIKFKFADSKSDSLIQLADMVVGAIARHYNGNRKDASRWFKLLETGGKIDNIWKFS